MAKKVKKMYLVKREVLATTIKEAMNAKGKIYAIELADDKFQPPPPPQEAGFKVK